MVSSKAHKAVQIFLKNVLAWFASLLVIIPLMLVFLNSFKADGETLNMSLALPKTWNFSNFAVVIEKGKLVQSFFNSLLYAGAGTVITVFLAAMASYVFSPTQAENAKIFRREFNPPSQLPCKVGN